MPRFLGVTGPSVVRHDRSDPGERLPSVYSLVTRLILGGTFRSVIKQMETLMNLIKLATSAAFAAGAALASMSALSADVTVRLVHVDQNPDVGAFYNDI